MLILDIQQSLETSYLTYDSLWRRLHALCPYVTVFTPAAMFCKTC